MSIQIPRIAVVLLLGVASVHAEDPAPVKQPDLPPYQLKNKSQFGTVDPSARAPFWPIGWVKPRPGSVTTNANVQIASRVQLDANAFRVTSILLGSGSTPSLAVINGRAYSEGEFLRMPKGGATPQPRIRVQRINDGNVILQNADQTLVASLVRPELSNKKAEDLILDPDR